MFFNSMKAGPYHVKWFFIFVRGGYFLLTRCAVLSLLSCIDAELVNSQACYYPP